MLLNENDILLDANDLSLTENNILPRNKTIAVTIYNYTNLFD